MLQQAIRVIQWQLTGLYHQHHWLEVLKVKVKSLSHVRLLATPWTIAYQAPPSTGVFQARVPEWGAIAFSRGSSQPRDRTMVSCITGRCFTIWATREVPKWKWTSLSVSDSLRPQGLQPMEFSRPEYWSGYQFPSPGDLPNPRIEPTSSSLQVDSLPAEPQAKPWRCWSSCQMERFKSSC